MKAWWRWSGSGRAWGGPSPRPSPRPGQESWHTVAPTPNPGGRDMRISRHSSSRSSRLPTARMPVRFSTPGPTGMQDSSRNSRVGAEVLRQRFSRGVLGLRPPPPPVICSPHVYRTSVLGSLFLLTASVCRMCTARTCRGRQSSWRHHATLLRQQHVQPSWQRTSVWPIVNTKLIRFLPFIEWGSYIILCGNAVCHSGLISNTKGIHFY